MNDAFDRFLAEALSPPEREPDRPFVARVRAGILVEQRLAAERSRLRARIFQQILALLTVAASLLVLGRAAPVAEWFESSPAAGLALLIVAFGLLIALIVGDPGRVRKLNES